MSTDLRPQTHEELPPTGLDQVSGVEVAPVHPATNAPGRIVLVVAAVVAVLLWQVVGFHVAVSVALAFLIYLVALYVVYRRVSGHRQAVNRVMTGMITGAFLLAVLPLISLLWTVTSNGIGLATSPDFLQSTMRGVDGRHDRAFFEEGAPLLGGVHHAIMGTLIITGIATLISVPIGLLTSIYLVEYGAGSKLAQAIRFMVDVMTGIPSIVAGLFAFALFSLFLGPADAKIGIAGSVALCVLMIPTVVRNSEEMLRIVPNELREAALALGVPKWRVILKVVLPTAASGLASGVTLSIARVIGETAPLLVTIGAVPFLNLNPVDGRMNTLAVYAYDLFKNPLSPGSYAEPSLQRAWAAALLLLVIVILLNLAARLIAKIFAPKTGR
ncbi:phosphate ABC transporter permease PstA [Ornithinimicrobium pratense]|uniref:Phosphate transport system permease protein PstA n=1 Tax=Ornithinimicrobium pratense TaxID=2593973 RepID=A0A5J6V198_9MICO|nr:phosphate ABC transporter permease PstA [Ornithinimicrobium pratense]QFG67540.1 phosphate ABC transporter permease PstA [Ornithinimicrobium pratense]